MLYIAEQLGIAIETYSSYNWNDRLSRYHRQEILDFLGVRKFIENDMEEIQDWLCQIVFPKGFSTSDSLEHVYEWLHQSKIDRLGTFQLNKIITASYSRFEKSLFESISNGISDDSKAIFDYCLKDKSDSISFTLLKSDPGRVSLDSVLKEIEKLEFINWLDLPGQQLTSLNSKIMSRIRSRVFSETSWELKCHPAHIRYVLMSVFSYCRRSEIIDGLVELLIQIIHGLSGSWESRDEMSNTSHRRLTISNLQRLHIRNYLILQRKWLNYYMFDLQIHSS